MRDLTYLATPYSDPDPTIRTVRYWHASAASHWLMNHGHVVLCPVTMLHSVAQIMDGGDIEQRHVSNTTEYWQSYTLALAARCDAFFILQIPGWQESKGVAAEIEHFARRGICPSYVRVGDMQAYLGPLMRIVGA